MALVGNGEELRVPLETLALLPTWQCDVACHHCVFESSPAKTGRLPLECAIGAIRELCEVSTVQRVTVSGGEAFLDIDYLVAIARCTNQFGLNFRVVTNANFATTQRRAMEVISELQRIGLETVAISWDSFHERFISPENVRNLIGACRILGVSCRVTVVVSAQHKLQEALDLLGDAAFEVPVTQVKCLPVGRAAKKVSQQHLLPTASHEIRRACASDFDTLSLTPNGSVFPCCAVGGFTDALRVGHYPSESMLTLLRRRAFDLRWALLSAQGPRYFADRLRPLEVAQAGLKEADHDCVTCHKIFGRKSCEPAIERIIKELRAEAAKICKEAPSLG